MQAHAQHHAPHGREPGASLWRSALRATLHCLTGCAIGEVLGLVLAAGLDWSTTPSIAVSVVLAFVFGYGLTLRPVLASGVPWRRAVGLVAASDTVSIGTMELVDNAFVLLVPGAMAAGLADGLFWWSLALALAIASCSPFPSTGR